MSLFCCAILRPRLSFTLFFFQSSSADPYCFVEFETKDAAEYALFAMNNRNVYDKVSCCLSDDSASDTTSNTRFYFFLPPFKFTKEVNKK